MTAGDFVRPERKPPFTRERLLQGRELTSARPQQLWAAVLLLGLTFLWVAVIWMAVFGSRPHTYLMVLAGTYTIGVLSGAGFSGVARTLSVQASDPSNTPCSWSRALAGLLKSASSHSTSRRRVVTSRTATT